MRTADVTPRVLTPPASEPVSAADALTQTHLRTEVGVDAELVDLYVTSAREDAENETRRQFVTATLLLELDGFPRGEIELPRPPLQSVTAVRYHDADGVLQTLDPSTYLVIGAHEPPVKTLAPMPGRVVLRAGASWPSVSIRPDAVQVEYVAGYGPDGVDVPAGIRHAILIHAADSYAQRETLVVGTVSSTLSRTVSNLLSKYLVP